MRTNIVVTSVCAVVLAYTFHTQAFAGFEWVPPKPVEKSKEAADMPSVPKADVDMVPLMPTDLPPLEAPAPTASQKPIVEQSKDGSATATITLDGAQDTQPMAPQKLRMSDTIATPDASAAQKTAAPVNLMKIKTRPAPAPAPQNNAIAEVKAALPSNTEFDDVVGFGNDMPLAIALQQIVPAEYAYSFGASVNPGERASWNGGRPWDQVLSEMLVSLNLKARMSGNTIVIVKANAKEANMVHYMGDETAMASSGQTAKSDPMNETVMLKRASIQDPGIAAGAQPSAPKADAAPAGLTDFTIDPHPFRSAPDGKDHMTWEAHAGDSLKEVLERWAKVEDVQLIWEASHDFTLRSTVFMTGSFRKAVNLLVSNSIDQEAAPIVQFSDQAGPNGTAVIVRDPSQINLGTG